MDESVDFEHITNVAGELIHYAVVQTCNNIVAISATIATELNGINYFVSFR